MRRNGGTAILTGSRMMDLHTLCGKQHVHHVRNVPIVEEDHYQRLPIRVLEEEEERCWQMLNILEDLIFTKTMQQSRTLEQEIASLSKLVVA